MIINTVEEMFHTLEKLGFVKESCEFGYLYKLRADIGKGFIKLTGHIDKYYLIDADFYFFEPMKLRFEIAIKDRFIEFNYIKTPFDITLHTDIVEKVTTQLLSCHVNTDLQPYTVSFPSKTRLTYQNVIIRESIMKVYYPNFYYDYSKKIKDLIDSPFSHPKLIIILNDLFNKKHWNISNQIYLNGKILEMISLLIDFLDMSTLSKLINPHYLKAIKNAYEIVADNYQEPLSLLELAKAVKVNVNVLKEGFKQVYGLTVFQEIRKIRMKKSIELLKRTDFTMEQIANEIGYASTTHFYKNFRLEFGMTPNQFRKNSDERNLPLSTIEGKVSF